MSRSSRTGASTSSMSLASHPHLDRDVVMGPPPLPPQASAPGSGSSDTKGRDKETLELAEKYRKLKRKYFELEEKHRDVTTELRGSGERSVKLRTERAYLLERISELEAMIQQPQYPGYPPPPPNLSSAYPRSLISPAAQKRFIGNLDRAMNEAEKEDHNVDPLLQSKHVGPNARKRAEAEQKERQEEEQKEQKKTTRQPRRKTAKEKEKEKEKETPLAASSSANHAGPSGERAGTRVSERERERVDKEREAASKATEQADRMDRDRQQTGLPLTLAPAPSSHRDLEMHNADSPTPSQASVPQSINGQHLYVKPPATPTSASPEAPPMRPPSPSPTSTLTPASSSTATPPPPPPPTFPSLPSAPSAPVPALPPPPPPTPQQDSHNHTPHQHEHDNEPRRSPIANRFDPREDQYHPPEHNAMDVDPDPPSNPPPQQAPVPLFTQPPLSPVPPPREVTPQAQSTQSVQSLPQPQSPPRPQTPPQPQRQPSPTTSDVPMSSRSTPEIRAALLASPPPAPPSPISPPPSSPRPVTTGTSAPAPDQRSASAGPRSPRKRSDSPAVMHSPSENNWPPPGAPASAQAAMMGQLVLSPPSPYRLTPVDPPPAPPAMQMTFRTSPATHVSQYGHTGSTGSNGTSASSQQQQVSQTQAASVSASATATASASTSTNANTNATANVNASASTSASPTAPRESYIDPQLYRSVGVTTPIGPGEHTITFVGNGLSNLGSSSTGSGPILHLSTLSGLGPPPGPILLQTPLNTPIAGAGGSRGKPKRLKAHTVTSKSFSIPMVPRDKVGKPLLPLNVGIMTVISLGTVCTREHFHTERYIFPVGYEVTRKYLSTVDPNVEAVYHCTILDGGDGPKFQIIASDDPDRPVIAGTATGAWSAIVRAANYIRNRQHSNSVSGPDFFGLGQNTIKHLIQELPDADLLQNYVWQNFVEGGPLGGRHAAVIPALPEERETSEGDTNYTSGSMGLVPTTQLPGSPQTGYFAGKPEEAKLHIVQVHSPNGYGPPQNITSPTERSSSMKPITFQQEFPQRYNKEYRAREENTRDTPGEGDRRGSVSSSHANDDHERRSSLSTQPWKSPSQQREVRSPTEHRSPYQTPIAPHQSPPVPATFASIMHAYSTSPIPGSGAPEGHRPENGTAR